MAMFVACLILTQAMMHLLGAVNETRHSNKKLVESRAYGLPEDLINRTSSARILAVHKAYADLAQARGGIARRRVSVSRD